MKPSLRPLSALLLTAALVLSAAAPAFALPAAGELEETAAYVRAAVPDPQSASTGGEWAVIGLARSGTAVPEEWYAAYLDNLTELAVRQQGVLSTRKYTEYARAVLALTALGEDPRDVGGYDLLSPLFDAQQVVRQGVNGAAYALIALDSRSYEAPDGLRETYLAYLLAAQLPDGGWALAGETSDPDITAQVLQALAPYPGLAGEAVERGLGALESMLDQGRFTTLESYAQALIALCTLGEEPWPALLDGFASYRLSDGSYRHLPGGSADQMATEQALCALCALARYEAGEPSLYAMEPLPAQSQEESAACSPAPLLCALLALVPACVLGLPAGT